MNHPRTWIVATLAAGSLTLLLPLARAPEPEGAPPRGIANGILGLQHAGAIPRIELPAPQPPAGAEPAAPQRIDLRAIDDRGRLTAHEAEQVRTALDLQIGDTRRVLWSAVAEGDECSRLSAAKLEADLAMLTAARERLREGDYVTLPADTPYPPLPGHVDWMRTRRVARRDGEWLDVWWIFDRRTGEYGAAVQARDLALTQYLEEAAAAFNRLDVREREAWYRREARFRAEILRLERIRQARALTEDEHAQLERSQNSVKESRIDIDPRTFLAAPRR